MTTAIIRYETARQALADCKSIDDVKDVRDKAEALRLYAIQAKDREMEIALGEIRSRAERRIGEIKIAMRSAGQLHEGGRPTKTSAGPEEVSKGGGLKLKLADLGVDEKLSMRAERLAKIPGDSYERLVARCREHLQTDKGLHAFDVLRERDGPINGARSIMGSRAEPDDSLDYFPTPPWATRALMQVALPQLRIDTIASIWEPACGEGHMSEVLREYKRDVLATDIFDYGLHQDGVCDFLDREPVSVARGEHGDWIITNPPFGEEAIRFVLRALELAQTGVAMFFRSQWAVEGIERYEQIFRDHPPTLFAPFVERVPLCKGRWDPDGNTATAYCWLAWVRGRDPQPPFWIPPGQRDALTKPTDRPRFAAWSLPQVAPDIVHPETGEIILPATASSADANSNNITEYPA